MRTNYFTGIIVVFAFVIGACDQAPVATVEEPLPIENEAASIRGMLDQEPARLAGHLKGRKVVHIPAGSVDAIAPAIKKAGDRGVVILEKGPHYESATVRINTSVFLIGEKGATLYVDTAPSPDPFSNLNPAIYIKDANNVLIERLHILPKREIGGTAIMVINSPRVIIAGNKIREHQFGIILGSGNEVIIERNDIIGSNAWRTGALRLVHGIVTTNGDRTKIKDNRISNTFFGIFVSGSFGQMKSNHVSNSLTAYVLCKMPAGLGNTPEGMSLASMGSASEWQVSHNKAIDNLNTGFLVIDGASKNKLHDNLTRSNGVYDYELAGETSRFGFPAPPSKNNYLYAKDHDVVKDCGVGNTVVGGELVDTVADPCS